MTSNINYIEYLSLNHHIVTQGHNVW